MSVATADTEVLLPDLNADDVATAARVARLHFPSTLRPGQCFRCGKPTECDATRWASAVLALAAAKGFPVPGT
jgi:hypothetical protein